jgi:hypothetical protein
MKSIYERKSERLVTTCVRIASVALCFGDIGTITAAPNEAELAA